MKSTSRIFCKWVKQTYDYGYDNLNRLRAAVSTSSTAKDNLYGENVTYDNMGNITSLGRYDNISGKTQIDTLTYTYSHYRVTRVDDSSLYTGAFGFQDAVKTANEYAYDGNGNELRDWNKGINSITYNLLNLPQTITKSDGSTITYVYNAAGNKLRKLVTAGGVTTTTEYENGIEYDNSTSTIAFIQTEEGRARKSGSSYAYEYDLKDHLGNTRVTLTPDPADGTQQTAKVLQENDYYAFGYGIQSMQTVSPVTKNEYLYNHKELQEETGLYDYGARFYDPVIGRWGSVDPLADATVSYSPYHYAAGNPINFEDLLGLMPHYRNGVYYEDDGEEVGWSYVQNWIEGNNGVFKPLTRSRLEQLGQQAGYGVPGSGKFNADLGNAFEAVAAEEFGFEGRKKTSFYSSERSAMTNGQKSFVEPDSYGVLPISDGSLWSLISPRLLMGHLVDVVSTMGDVKSTGKSSISLSYDSYQILGFLDVASKTPAGKEGRSIFSLITLSGVSIGKSVIREAQEKKVSIYQSVAMEQYIEGKSTGNIGFSIFYPIYETIPKGHIGIPNLLEISPYLNPIPLKRK